MQFGGPSDCSSPGEVSKRSPGRCGLGGTLHRYVILMLCREFAGRAKNGIERKNMDN